MTSDRLLARLLIASATTGACSSSGTSGQDAASTTVQLASGPRTSVSVAALPSARAPAPRARREPPEVLRPLLPEIPSGWHSVQPPEPPLKPVQPPRRFADVSTQPGDRPLKACDESFFMHVTGASGGSFFSSYCYERVPPDEPCLGATEPPLRRALGFKDDYVNCVSDGPYEQLSDGADASLCCYNTGWHGIGRPLVVGARPVRATLRHEAGWG